MTRNKLPNEKTVWETDVWKFVTWNPTSSPEKIQLSVVNKRLDRAYYLKLDDNSQLIMDYDAKQLPKFIQRQYVRYRRFWLI